MYQIWRIYLDLWGHDCKKWVWPTFGCKLGQNDPIVMQLKLDMSCRLLNVYTKFQIDISKHVEEKSEKRRQTDGRTLPRHNTSRFSNGRIKRVTCNFRTPIQPQLEKFSPDHGYMEFSNNKLSAQPFCSFFISELSIVLDVYIQLCQK